MVEDKKFSFKANLVFGIIFLLASVFYLLKAKLEPTALNWFIFGSSLLISMVWFILSFTNYKKSKKAGK